MLHDPNVPLRLANLVEAPQEPDDLLARGERAFGGGRFFEAQVQWETEALAASGETRAWIQGLATIAAGMLAREEQRLATAERLIARGRWMLAKAPEHLARMVAPPAPPETLDEPF